MSTINGYLSSSYYDSNDFSSFSKAQQNSSSFLAGLSIGGSSGGDGLMGINFADYKSISNGSYGRLLKQYYSKMEGPDKSGSKDKGKATDSRDYRMLQSTTSTLEKTANDLTKSSLWQKKSITSKDEDGKSETRLDYDMDAIEKAVNSFVKSYNDILDEVSDSNSTKVLQQGMWMTNITDKNAGILKDVGISIGKGNKLELDKNKLKSADIGTLKTLFSGQNSFAGQVGRRATQITNAAASSGSSYSSNATYNSLMSKLSSRYNKYI